MLTILHIILISLSLIGTHDAKGNIATNSNGQTYGWDFDNRLQQAVVPLGSRGIAGTHNYTYDALGRRVSKAIGGTSPSTTIFVSSGQQVIAEYLGGTAAATAERKYIHASYIDERCVMIDRTALGALGAGLEELFYYHTNNLYSVTALTTSTGAVQERYAYDAYGNILYLNAAGTPLATQASTVAQPYTFTERRSDDETGLYYYRLRYYDSSLGRFIGRDPIEYSDGPNAYQYVGGRPAVLLDPSGDAAISLAAAGKALEVAGGVLEVIELADPNSMHTLSYDSNTGGFQKVSSGKQNFTPEAIKDLAKVEIFRNGAFDVVRPTHIRFEFSVQLYEVDAITLTQNIGVAFGNWRDVPLTDDLKRIGQVIDGADVEFGFACRKGPPGKVYVEFSLPGHEDPIKVWDSGECHVEIYARARLSAIPVHIDRRGVKCMPRNIKEGWKTIDWERRQILQITCEP